MPIAVDFKSLQTIDSGLWLPNCSCRETLHDPPRGLQGLAWLSGIFTDDEMMFGHWALFVGHAKSPGAEPEMGKSQFSRSGTNLHMQNSSRVTRRELALRRITAGFAWPARNPLNKRIHFIAGLERDHELLRDEYFLASSRVSSIARRPLLDLEDAKASQFDAPISQQ